MVVVVETLSSSQGSTHPGSRPSRHGQTSWQPKIKDAIISRVQTSCVQNIEQQFTFIFL